MTDYRKLRFSNLNTPQFRHLFLLLFWVVFGSLFLLVERGIPGRVYHPVQCPLDDRIPLCEWFLIPYLFWFLFLFGMHLYLLLEDIPAFRRFMHFIILTFSITIAIYFVYPTCQELRPGAFARDNVLTRFLANFYVFDTNTNVCPSLHCTGSMAVVFAAWDTDRFRKGFPRVAFTVMGLLISVSTVMIKQHSVVDVVWAMVLSAAGYWAVYVFPKCVQKKKVQKWQERTTT